MPDLEALSAATLAMLRAALPPIDGQSRVFDGGLVDDSGQNAVPPTAAGTGRVLPHWVVYFDPGLMVALDVAGQSLVIPDWGFQLTCVGASRGDAMWAVQLARDTLNGQRPLDPDLHRVGLFQEIAKAGPVRMDRGVQPNRFYLPLVYGLMAA